MEGCRRREVRDVQKAIALAWRIANFGRAGKNFKDLDKYLDEMKPPVDRAEQAAAIFSGFEKRGLVKIKERAKRNGG